MGGIFGYACKEARGLAAIREGLRRLVYRGHDGAGFAAMSNGRIVARKAAGHIERIEERLFSENIVSRVAVGHTRYASRGVPADFNSHPLLDCAGKVAVVMDGIVNGYEEVREALRRRGHVFLSTTDTEVLAHVIEELLPRGDMLEILREAYRRLDGSFAAAVMIEGREALGLMSKGQPLVVGVSSDGCAYVSSDVSSLHGFLDEAIVLEDGLVALLEPGALAIHDAITGASVEGLQRKRVKHAPELIEKGGYPHYMLKEIYEVPDALLRTLSSLMEKYLRLSAMIIHGARNVIVIGNGSSLHAGLISQYYFSELAGLSVSVTSAAEFPYYALDSVTTGTVIVAISQSGETSDVIRSVRLAKQRGAVIVGVTNTLGSRLTMHSNVYLPIGAGPEIAVPATKTFTSSVAALAVLASHVGLHTGKLDRGEVERVASEIRAAAKLLRERTEELERGAEEAARRLADKESAYVSGSGIGYPVVLEGALKLKEAALIHAEGVQLGELRHGPIAILGSRRPIILLEPVEEQARELYERVLGELKSREATLVEIGERSDVLRISSLSRIVTPILYAVPVQLLAYKLGVMRGTPIDTPPGLAKAITN